MDRPRQPAVHYGPGGSVTFLTEGHGDLPATDGVMVMLRTVLWMLRQVRLSRGLALHEVAAQCGCVESTLSRAERAVYEPRIRLHTVLSMCNVLGVRFSEIVRIAEDEAFPVGDLPWTDDAATLLRHLPSATAARKRAAQGGDA